EMLMIEGSADQIPEDRFVEALEFAHNAIQPIIRGINQLRELAGKPKKEFPLVTGDERVSAIVRREAAEKLQTAVFQDKKQDRADAVNKVKEETAEIVTKELGEDNFDPVAIKIAFEELEEEAYRENILKHGKRVD